MSLHATIGIPAPVRAKTARPVGRSLAPHTYGAYAKRAVGAGLTPAMAQVKALIAAACDGSPPTFEEMAKALGLKSRSNISRLIDALVERGHVARDPGHAHSLRIVQHSCPHCGGDLLAAPVHPGPELEVSS
jgi:hypothetical protein